MLGLSTAGWHLLPQIHVFWHLLGFAEMTSTTLVLEVGLQGLALWRRIIKLVFFYGETKRHKYDPSLYLYDLVVKILKQQQFFTTI